MELPEVRIIRDYGIAFYSVVRSLFRIIKFKVYNAENKPGHSIPLHFSLYQDVDQNYHDSDDTGFCNFSVEHHPTDVHAVLWKNLFLLQRSLLGNTPFLHPNQGYI